MPSVLFVCTANRIRSPLAEGFFRRALTGAGENPAEWHIASAGTWTSQGLPAMPLAQQVGRDRGIDLSAHQSTPIGDVDLASFDVIVVMERGQREALIFEMPALVTRVHLLGELVTGVVYDVVDPVGGPLPSYSATAQELDRLIDVASPRIIELTRE